MDEKAKSCIAYSLPIHIYLANFFENEPNEICSHLNEKTSKGMFLKPESHCNEGKGKEKKKEQGEEKTAMATLSVLIIATLDIFFGREKLLDEKGLLSDNVIKNPARYILHAILTNSALGRAS